MSLVLLFVVFAIALSEIAPTPPPTPVWTDFQTSFFLFRDEEWGPTKKTAGEFWYKPSSKFQRVDYFAICEPHTNFTDARFDCSYIFNGGLVYFRTTTQCCYWAELGPTDPHLWSDATYIGVEVVHGKAVNHWTKVITPTWSTHYYADVATYVPIRFHSVSPFVGTGGLDFVYYNQAAIMDDSLFHVDPTCQVKCPWAESMEMKEEIQRKVFSSLGV